MFGKKNQHQPRGFGYTPRFWNEEKEEFKSRIADAERRYHGKRDENYTPSKNFSFRSGGGGKASPRDSRFETTYGRTSATRVLFLVVLLSAIVYLMFFFS